MPRDRTGNRYETLLEASLLHLGYLKNSDVGMNYQRPSAGGQVIIPNTYIQPDIVIRHDNCIKAILYVTHWSNRRNSNFKFWRTWEEEAQQKIILRNDFLAVNCLFEALPSNYLPDIYVTSDDLPRDVARGGDLPIGFNGWYPATSWALVEAFDVNIVFPVSYQPLRQGLDLISGEHDLITTKLLQQALINQSKDFLRTQWIVLSSIRENAVQNLPDLNNTESRYRTGLLHLYLLHRIICRALPSHSLAIDDLVRSIVEIKKDRIEISVLANSPAFSSLGVTKTYELFELLSQVYVRKGKDAETLCKLTKGLSNSNSDQVSSTDRIEFNSDMQMCLRDLGEHIGSEDFINAVQGFFIRFDSVSGINEVFEDLSNVEIVRTKEQFVRNIFSSSLNNELLLNDLLQAHAKNFSSERLAVSIHQQNWILEILLLLTGLTSDEDIQTKLTENFELSGHRLRPHAPYGDDAKLIRYLLQGRDICEHWSSRSRSRTLSQDEFRNLSWQTIAKSIIQAFVEKGSVLRDSNTVVRQYIQNKSMRVIGADLNAFHILIETYLGDLCSFIFSDNTEEELQTISHTRICPSWQTDVINTIFTGRPLETWLEGGSKNGAWLIKVQSAPNNPSDKTKEIAGRCRALRLAWSHGQNPRDRTQWTFSARPLPKLALVLDGDWDANKKRNLYEAGWDWVGDVAQLGELRRLIQQDR